MAVKKSTLRVCVNPYLVTDSEGRPCCVVQLDPSDPRYPQDARGWRGHIGARIADAVLEREGNEETLRASRHSLSWSFAERPFDLPLTDYYKRQVADGSLIAADAETAALCRAQYIDPGLVRFNTQLETGASDAVWFDADTGDKPAE